MLATTGALPARQSAYSFEVKWDGVRGIAYIEDGRLHLDLYDIATVERPPMATVPAYVATHSR